MERTQLTIPVVALRGLTVLPQMIISFDISRKKSIAAVEKAMVGDQKNSPGNPEADGGDESAG